MATPVRVAVKSLENKHFVLPSPLYFTGRGETSWAAGPHKPWYYQALRAMMESLDQYVVAMGGLEPPTPAL